MDGDDNAEAARAVGLAAAVAAFPEEIASAIALAREQGERLAAIALDSRDAS